MSTPADEGDPDTVTEPPVTLVRDVSVRDGGVVVEFRLRTDAPSPTDVELRQSLPEETHATDTEFLRDAGPDRWHLDDGTLVATVTVPAGTVRTLVAGLSVDPERPSPAPLPLPDLSVAGDGDDAPPSIPSPGGTDDGARGDGSPGSEGADPATLEEAVRRVEAGEAPEHDLREGLPPADPSGDGDDTVELTRETLATLNEELMWLRAKVVVAEREREELRTTVAALREALAGVDAVDAGALPERTGTDTDGAVGADSDDATDPSAR